MTYFIKRDNTYSITDSAAVDITTILPPNTYLVKYSEMRGFYLEIMNNFTLPDKVYGDVHTRADRVINTFNTRKANTGVMLLGEKGSGKTMMSKLISSKLRDTGVPTIIVNTGFYGDEFITFINSVEQECVIFIDEFDKSFGDDERQAGLLTLLDGVFVSKKLFILTANDDNKINYYLYNRPGRIFYSFKYEGLDDQFIKEYSEDNLIDRSHIGDIMKLSMTVEALNFDSLQALIEELNRYGESVKTALQYINISSDIDRNYYDVELTMNGVVIPSERLENKGLISRDIEVYFTFSFMTDPENESHRHHWEEIKVAPEHLTDIDTRNKQFVYKSTQYDAEVIVKLQKKKWASFKAF